MRIESLLQPVSADNPCGPDLTYSTDFDAIAEMRREDDASLEQGDWVQPLKTADWPGVAARCTVLLKEQAKDLRVAGWLADAWGRLEGFDGLADGLVLNERLCRYYWPSVHPRADDGSQEQRAGALAWLLAQVADLAGSAPLLVSAKASLGARLIKAARHAPRGGQRAEGAAPDSGVPTLDELMRVHAETPTDFLRVNLRAIERAIEALDRLQQRVGPLLGDDAPGFGESTRALEEARDSARALLARDEARPDASMASGPSQPAATPRGQPGLLVPESSPGPGNEAETTAARADALAQLRAVAAFFRRTEPHSPVAYLAEKAAAWGEMPLHLWLREVVKDGGTLGQLEDVLGVPKQAR